MILNLYVQTKRVTCLNQCAAAFLALLAASPALLWKALEDLKALSSFVMKELEVHMIRGGHVGRQRVKHNILCKVQVHDQVNGIVGGTAQTGMLRSSAFLEDRSRQLPAQARHVWFLLLLLVLRLECNSPTFARCRQI